MKHGAVEEGEARSAGEAACGLDRLDERCFDEGHDRDRHVAASDEMVRRVEKSS